MIFNMADGGGKVAKITVNTASSASVTCEQFPYTLSATADSNGIATFQVPKAGMWTLNASKNGITGSNTVTIDSYHGDKSVTVSLKLWLFMSGTGVVTPIVYYRSASSQTPISGTNSFDFMYNSSTVGTHPTTSSPINLSNYSKFVVEAVHLESDHEIWMLAGNSISDVNTAIINECVCPSREIITFDISSITGNKYVGLYNGSSTSATCFNWYLEA